MLLCFRERKLQRVLLGLLRPSCFDVPNSKQFVGKPYLISLSVQVQAVISGGDRQCCGTVMGD